MRLILCEKFPLNIILRQVYQKVEKSNKYYCNLFIEELKSFLKKKFLEICQNVEVNFLGYLGKIDFIIHIFLQFNVVVNNITL